MDDAMERERKLIQEVQAVLPEFAAACALRGADVVIMHQEAFAPTFGLDEIILLGKAIKYAGILGKEVRILPSKKNRVS